MKTVAGCLRKINKLFIMAVMIRSFADKETEALFRGGKSRRLPPELLRRAILRLNQLDHVLALDEMRIPASNRLEALKGDRGGQWSVRINDQWRLCFRFEDGDAFAVEIADYH
ncbi:MAG: type II toxin-antitoxin system RelE/ParE family toxin [Rhodocyclaceae bacterium]|nr:type II toxin-antitoxin system RelE/ParE family toxin [Rhodocyclaceae bacterium]